MYGLSICIVRGSERGGGSGVASELLGLLGLLGASTLTMANFWYTTFSDGNSSTTRHAHASSSACTMQKGRIRGLAYRGSTVAYGSFGIKTMDEGFITSRQIEAARIAITRYMKREGQVWIRIFPDKPMTSKPAEVRMGKGKGAPSHWVAPVRPGRIMFEVDGVELDTAKEALRLGAQKLPVRCKLVTRPDLAEK